MGIGIRPGETWEYTLKWDRNKPDNKKTVFILKNLSAQEVADIQCIWNLPHGQMKAINKGLVGWRNFKDEKGQEIPFQSENPADCIHLSLWPDFFAEIMKMTQTSHALKKSSKLVRISDNLNITAKNARRRKR